MLCQLAVLLGNMGRLEKKCVDVKSFFFPFRNILVTSHANDQNQSPLFFFPLNLPKRLQLDMVLSSLQDQSHVASLLGYSNFGEVTTMGPPLTPAMSVRPPSSSSSVEAYDLLHLAEVLLKTLLLSISFYTVWYKDFFNF